MRPVQPQHQRVGVPVAEDVHPGSDEERDESAARATDQVADAHEERRKRRKQHPRLQQDSSSNQPRRAEDRLTRISYMMGSGGARFNRFRMRG